MRVDDEIDSSPTRDGQHVDAVYVRLRSAILKGELAPGVEISQVQIAEELGVSRTPLREALRMLIHEGLITSEPNRRVRVAALSAHDLEQVYVMRLTLESAAIRLTVPRLTEEAIADLGAHLAKMDYFAVRGDYDRWRLPHRAFHRGLIELGGDRIVEACEVLSDHAERYRRMYTESGRRAWDLGRAEHQQILDAVHERDDDLASRRLSDHLARVAYRARDLVDRTHPMSLLDDVIVRLGASAAAQTSDS